jgi:hypothetical protein
MTGIGASWEQSLCRTYRGCLSVLGRSQIADGDELTWTSLLAVVVKVWDYTMGGSVNDRLPVEGF